MDARVFNTLLLGGLIVAGVYYVKKVTPAVTTALNPTNPDNIANQSFNTIYQAVTGSTQSLGADVYDLTHFDAFDEQSQSVYQLPPMY